MSVLKLESVCDSRPCHFSILPEKVLIHKVSLGPKQGPACQRPGIGWAGSFVVKSIKVDKEWTKAALHKKKHPQRLP